MADPKEPESEGAKKTGDDKPAKLHVFADVDVKSLGVKDLKDGNVGHAWISLEWKDPSAVPDDIEGSHKSYLTKGGKYADPMGFWPDIFTGEGGGYSTDLLDSYVKGYMLHPDRKHEGDEKATQSWDITESQARSVIKYAESKRSAKYSVYFYNCTTFAGEAAKKAGQSPPSHSTAGICYPNALYDGIKARHDKGKGDTSVKDLDAEGEVTGDRPRGDSKKTGS